MQSIDEMRVEIGSDADIITARSCGRALSVRLGFTSTETTLIATAISELARNILQYARRGEIIIGLVEDNGRRGVTLLARDRGPGIPDISRAMEVGYSTSGGLGLGLPGVKRLMDEFEISSEPERGTTIVGRRWQR